MSDSEIKDMWDEIKRLREAFNKFEIKILEKYANRLPTWASFLFMALSSAVTGLICVMLAKGT